MMLQRIWPVLMATLLAIGILCGLGVWQVKRLAWKEALIAEIDARMNAMPVSLSDAALSPEVGEYQRVVTVGRYQKSEALRRIGVNNGGAGYGLLQPFVSNDGIFVLVDRGTIAIDDKDPAVAPTINVDVELIGLVRFHNLGRGLFDGDNDPKNNVWVWWDIPAMITAAHPPPNVKLAPFILQLVPANDLPAKPFIAAPKAELRNNHLGYAITWFGLAAALIAVAGVFIWRQYKVTE